ncbi:hypothetical protein [Frigoribacterium sp. CFBP 13712]|uniref:hypothetical protein n=1 Tax=Frigoribacterium sp. CFBP 13712 TaxID=2775309 RepID=UPI00177AD4CA|nr:hypothetical protein [Frigoribacterium sp. CFBP 13712]MBD8703084.1 hypothetical protein [Frigoribacterium sp. CFBP 13712]
MELLFVVLGGVIVGLLAHFVLPGRDTRGVALAPAVGAAVAAVVWEGLTWLGWSADGGWIWVVSLVAPAVVSAVVCRVTTRSRRAHDDALVARLVG